MSNALPGAPWKASVQRIGEPLSLVAVQSDGRDGFTEASPQSIAEDAKPVRGSGEPIGCKLESDPEANEKQRSRSEVGDHVRVRT